MLKFLLICLIATVDAKLYFEDYCWRDYSGIPPSDALQGGLDRNGRPIYIGQALHDNKLIPGKIPENGGKIYYEWERKEYSTNENVKILCTDQPQKFEWISTKSNEVHQLTNTLLIKGGFEANLWTYIGRMLADGETSVGKVMCMTSDCHGLYITDNGKFHKSPVFQILSFNPKTEEIDKCIPEINVRLE